MGASKAPPPARIFNWFPCVAFFVVVVVVAVFNYSREHGKAKDAADGAAAADCVRAEAIAG